MVLGPDWLAGELEADREAKTDPGEVYEDADAFKAALHVVRSFREPQKVSEGTRTPDRRDHN